MIRFLHKKGEKPAKLQMTQNDIFINVPDKLIYAKGRDGKVVAIGEAQKQVANTVTVPTTTTETFIDLIDTPTNYAGQAGKFAAVKGDESGLEFLSSSSSVAWGAVTGTLSDQTDLQDALDLKFDKTGGHITGHTTLANGTSDAPNLYWYDDVNKTNASIDVSNEKLRILGSYRNGAEWPFVEYDINTGVQTFAVTPVLHNPGTLPTLTLDEEFAYKKYVDDNDHVHNNKAVLDLFTDAGSGIVISDTERTKLNGLDGSTYELKAAKGVANGYAELDSSGLVPSAQIPAGVDAIQEYADFASLPASGEHNIIYVTLDDNKTYRWSGTSYVEISSSLALGETSGTAYRGDRGKEAYDHSQLNGNPHNTAIVDIANLQTSLDSKYDKSGGDITGTVTVHVNSWAELGLQATNTTKWQLVSDGSDSLEINYISDISAGTHITPLFFDKTGIPNFLKLPLLPSVTPTSAFQSASKKYVDDSVFGLGVGDMLKNVYDLNDNGIVDDAEKVNGLTVETAVPSGALFTDTTYTDAEIKTKYENNANTNAYTDADKDKLNDIDFGAERNVQSDWDVSTTSLDTYIENKPEIRRYNTLGGTLTEVPFFLGAGTNPSTPKLSFIYTTSKYANLWMAGGSFQLDYYNTTNSVNATAFSLDHSNGEITFNESPKVPLLPTDDNHAVPRKYLDKVIKRVQVWGEDVDATQVPTNSGVLITDFVTTNPITSDYTGFYEIIYASTDTDIETSAGAPNYSTLLIGHEDQQVAGGMSGGWFDGSGNLNFSTVSMDALSKTIDAYGSNSTGITDWYIHRVYRLERIL